VSNLRHLSDKPSAGRSADPDVGGVAFEDPAAGLAAAPGAVLRRVLEQRHITQSELALRTGLSTKTVNQIMLGTAALTPDTALRLERTLAVPSGFWNRLEAAYRDREARERSAKDFEQHLRWFRRFPKHELERRGAVTPTADELHQVEELLGFFGVADPDAYRRVWEAHVAAGFRRAKHLDVDEHATALWLRLAERQGQQLDLAPYDAAAFAALLPQLRPLTQQTDALAAFRKVTERCAAVGVAVVFVPEVTGTRVCGVARWMSSAQPLLALSGRYRKADSFWFTFFHEAGHILLHPKREACLTLEGQRDDGDGLEEDANRFAARTLIGLAGLRTLRKGMTFAEIKQLAEQVHVGPGIVAGQLCHRFGEWSRLSRLRPPLTLS
jgi:HTH-type transcriptional regulator/antitoxin HigA